MKAIDVARMSLERGAIVFRDRKDSPGEYDAKPYFGGNKRGWVALDHFTASAIVQVHDALNEANRAHFAALSLNGMARVAFKLISVRGKAA